MSVPTCAQLERTAALELPNSTEANRLDGVICALMVIIFVISQGRFSYWAYNSMQHSTHDDNSLTPHKIRVGVVNATSASAAFLITIALPAQWIRNAILKRDIVAIRHAATEHCKNAATRCVSECRKLEFRVTTATKVPSDIVVRATGFALAAAFLLASCTVTFHASTRLIGRTTTTTAQSPERHKKSRFAVKVLDNEALVNKDDDDNEEHCVVCLGELSEMTACELRCGHRFHKRCIEKWLRKASRPCCPLCQKVVQRVHADDEV